ncbi:DUF427 domain-containing protein [Mycolicibacterium xanthum]|uniref:DUF427 domain-containing protein n=1 Tax=Mycolicibacterium xanthum TaxID=2796469 RepID=UPI0021070CF1|nr:DUF427 domain-containing protein [Mycolicibacterium xanthum]
MAAARGRVEPAPRRVRGFLGHELVFDTTSARYVWEVPYYPHYYIPLTDVRPGFLRDEGHPQKVQFGPSRLFALTGSAGVFGTAARVFDDDGGPVAGLVRFEWAALTWFEEDEPVYGHPRNPYVRVDALRSHRHVTVSLDGVTLADTHSPVLLFETGLPTRYYIDRTDVAFGQLTPTDTETLCPYKGVTSGYWAVRVGNAGGGNALHADLAWTYHTPLPAVAAIANMIAFYNEKVDLTVDGVPLPRPKTHFG